MTDPGNLLNAEDSMDFEEERICLSTHLDNNPTVDAKIIDSADTVQMLAPKVRKTFQDYDDNVFVPYILHQLEQSAELTLSGISFCQAAARGKRGSGP